MTGLSAPPDAPADVPAPLGAELNDTVFRSVAAGLTVTGEPGHGLSLELAIADLLTEMVSTLGENSIGGSWDPKQDIPRHTTDYLDKLQDKYRATLVSTLSDWNRRLNPDRQIRLLVHLWWECFELWDRSLAYRTIEAVADAVAEVAAEDSPDHPWEPWQRDTWRAAGAALRVLQWDGRVFAQVNLSSADRLKQTTHEATTGTDRLPGVATIRDDLLSAWRQLNDQPGQAAQQVAQCVAYMWAYMGQVAIFYRVTEKMADALVKFEDWLARAGHADGAQAAALRPLSLSDAPASSVAESLDYLAEVKGSLSSRTLSEIEPWEQMLIQLRDLMRPARGGDATRSVLVPRRVWVRYCFPFAVRDDDGERVMPLLKTQPETSPHGAQPDGDRHETPRHPLSVRLQQELDEEVGRPGLMDIGDPSALAQTEFFQVDSSEDGHFGGIRLDLPDLVFREDFLEGAGPRPYKAWLDLNRMGNFCLCVEATEPLMEIVPPRLYRALRAGTPFVFGEPVALAPDGPGAPAWDNLHTFARGVIKAAANACYYSSVEAKKKDASGDSKSHYVVRANLHEVVVVQTAGKISDQSEDIASQLDAAVGGPILLRSLQRAAGTLEEWIRFPPLQRGGQHGRGTAIVAVPEIGYAGDWLVHTGETTVFGIVAVPAWFRDVYLEAAQFASSWSPVLQLWNQRLQVALKDAASKKKGADADQASEELREVEQQVRQHLAEINSEDLCATLAYRRFLDVLLEAVGIGRLENELQAQLQAAEQMTDYFSQRLERNRQERERQSQRDEREHQKQEKKAGERRDILLLFIAVFGVFSVADFLALLDTTNFHGRIGFIRLAQSGQWQDLLVLVLFAVVLVGGVLVWFWGGLPEQLLRIMRWTGKPEASGDQSHEGASHDREA
jgi:hypothetical protein